MGTQPPPVGVRWGLEEFDRQGRPRDEGFDRRPKATVGEYRRVDAAGELPKLLQRQGHFLGCLRKRTARISVRCELLFG